MAKQGERYNPKTRTGWKYENGKAVYYKKGKILNNRQQLLSLGKDIAAPLVSGAQVIRDRLKISPLSETGETAFEYKDRTGAYKREQLPDVQPRTWSNDPTQKYNKPSSVDNLPVKKEEIPSDKPFKNTVEGNGSVKKPDAKLNLVKTSSPTWTVDQERAKWLHETRNSPAARAGLSDDLRWEARQNHIKFKKKRKNKKKLSVKG